MDSRSKELIKQGDYGWSQRLSLDSFWQEAADNFYPERADFTSIRNLGRDFAADLTTSYPILARRELADSFSTMLRPKGQDWFETSVIDDEHLDNDAKKWLQAATKLQRSYMYERHSQFVRASKECDNDFATFGNAVKSVRSNQNFDGLLYQTWHLRDCIWFENESGMVDTLHRKWKPTALELSRIFRDKCHPRIKEAVEKEPYRKVEVRHIMIPTENYHINSGEKKFKQPFTSVFIDIENSHIMEEVGSWDFQYIVERWQTVSGSQYAYSPAVVAALPDARLIQSMTLTLLEAGQKAVDPPLVGTQDAVRSDVNTYAGGITWVDYAYDERLGEALRPMTIDKSGLQYGVTIREDTRAAIAEAFYLNKINLPNPGREMTAYETSQRIQEYIRNAIPLFEPIQDEDNAATCDMTFQQLLRRGAFGSIEDMPESLSGQEIKFIFKNPLSETSGREKGQRLLEVKAMLAEAVALDPSSQYILNTKVALRDALGGMGTPAKWLNSEKDVEGMSEASAQQQELQQTMQMMQQGGEVAEQIGKAGQAVNSAGMM